jgi:hypothetical protein
MLGVDKKRRDKTFCSIVGSPVGFRDGLEPAGLYAVKAALTLYELFAGHVDGAIVIVKGNASAPADDNCTYEESEEKEEKGGENDEKGKEDEESFGGGVVGHEGIGRVVDHELTLLISSFHHSPMSTLSSPKTRRKPSTRRRAGSHPPYPSQESHDTALAAIRSFLKGHTSYDAFPVSFRLIVLDTKLNVKKALQCLLLNGMYPSWILLLASSPTQVSFLPPSGTASNQSLPECLPSSISSISSSTTIVLLPTTTLSKT